jgi:hypothetical protein
MVQPKEKVVGGNFAQPALASMRKFVILTLSGSHAPFNNGGIRQQQRVTAVDGGGHLSIHY